MERMINVVHDLLLHAADRFPDKPALFFKETTMTYAEILTQSQQLAKTLIDAGVGRGDRVAFFMEKRFEKVIAIFGVSLAGGVFVPIRRLLHAKQMAHIINNSGAKVLITTASRLADCAEILHELPALETVIVIDGKEEPATGWPKSLDWLSWLAALEKDTFASLPAIPVIATDIAAILYTSGSTGNPKGVVLSHLNIVAGAKKVSAYLKITERDRLLSILTFSFDYGLNQLTSAFLHGAQLVLLDYLFPKDVLKAVERYQLTSLAAVATTWIQLLQVSWNEFNLKSLRYLTNTGGAIPENYVRELRRRLPHVDIYLMYGLTEAFRSTYLDPALVDQRPTSIGKAIPGEEIMVLDENNQPVKPGGVGELVHRGVLVAQGYWNEPELTAQRYRPNPLQPQEVPLREMVVYSGDYVRMDEEGFLYFIGRKDEMIKCAGNRISPTEVEEIVYASDKVQEVVALGIPHEIYGQVVKVVAVAKTGISVTADDLIAFCKHQMPPFMVPVAIEFRNSLPHHANGKLDRSQVKKEVLQNNSTF